MIKLTYEQFNSLHDCVSTDNVKFTLNGVYFDGDKVVAVDGKRMFIVTLPEAMPEGIDGKIVQFPRKCKKQEFVVISLDSIGQVQIEYMNTKRMTSERILPRLCVGKFPNWRLLLQKEERPEYTVRLRNNIMLPYYSGHELQMYGQQQIRVRLTKDRCTDETENDVQFVIMPMKKCDDTPETELEYLRNEVRELNARINELEKVTV